jgi:hypothetical protein
MVASGYQARAGICTAGRYGCVQTGVQACTQLQEDALCVAQSSMQAIVFKAALLKDAHHAAEHELTV